MDFIQQEEINLQRRQNAAMCDDISPDDPEQDGSEAADEEDE